MWFSCHCTLHKGNADGLLLPVQKCTTFIVQTMRLLSTHACAMSGRMVCTLTERQFCCCLVALCLMANYYAYLCTQWVDGPHIKYTVACCFFVVSGPTLHYIHCGDLQFTENACICSN